MKLLYVIAMGHSGSTLLDCILGTHHMIHSSGELRYLGWQLYRSSEVGSGYKDAICSCHNSFQECEFWSEVFNTLNTIVGVDFLKHPMAFRTDIFNQFSYKNRGGFSRTYSDKINSLITREMCEYGVSYKKLYWLKGHVKSRIENNFLLYKTMLTVAKRDVVIDSSKHLMYGMLFQQERPENVILVFLSRSIEGLAASYKKRKGIEKLSLQDIIKVNNYRTKFLKRVQRMKENIAHLKYLDINYEDLVEKPASVLSNTSDYLGLNKALEIQTNSNFYIDASKQHLVAGNPMRLKGRQKVQMDTSWKYSLSNEEIYIIKKIVNT